MEQKRYESDMTAKEKAQKQLRAMRRMSPKQLLEHLAAYYKTHMLLLVLTILFVYFCGFCVYRFNMDTILNVLIMNTPQGDAKRIETGFMDYMDDHDRFHEALVDDGLLFNGEETSDRYKEMKVSSYIQNQLVDVMILDQKLFDLYKESNLLEPCFKILSEEESRKLGLRAVDGYGFDITGNTLLSDCGYAFEGSVYLVIMADAPYPEHAKRFLLYLQQYHS